MDLKDKMMFFGVTLSSRYSKKQKQFFLEMMMQHAKDLHQKHDLLVKHAKFYQVASFVIGDIQKANTIVACAYDTPGKGMIPLKYYPFNSKKNTEEETKNTIFSLVIAGVLFVILFYVLKDFRASSTFIKIVRIVTAGLLAFWCVLTLTGTGNRVNFSRNSAAVALVSKLADDIRNPNVAYVFLDQMVNSYEGMKVLKETIGEQKTIVLLDGIARGEKVVVAHREHVDVSDLLQEDWVEKEYDETCKNALQFFPRSIQISCGDIKDHQFVVSHVRSIKDNQVDMKRLDLLSNVLGSYLKGR